MAMSSLAERVCICDNNACRLVIDRDLDAALNWLRSYFVTVRKSMVYPLLTIGSLLAYGVGLVIIVRTTPLLFVRSFDEGLFMGIAALDILGAMLSFGAFVITYSLFNGNLPIKVLDFFMLVGITIIAASFARSSFRPRTVTGTVRTSRIMTGSYGIFLVLIALYCLVLLFIGQTQ